MNMQKVLASIATFVIVSLATTGVRDVFFHPTTQVAQRTDMVSTFVSGVHAETRQGCIQQYGSGMADVCNESYSK